MGLHQLLIESRFAPLDRSDPHRSQVQGYFPRGPSPRRLSYPVGKRMSRRFCRPMSNFAFQLSANSPGAAAARIVAFAMLLNSPRFGLSRTPCCTRMSVRRRHPTTKYRSPAFCPSYHRLQEGQKSGRSGGFAAMADEVWEIRDLGVSGDGESVTEIVPEGDAEHFGGLGGRRESVAT